MGLGIGVVLVLAGLVLSTGLLDLPGALGVPAFDLGIVAAGIALVFVALVSQAARNRRRNTGRSDDSP